MLPKCKCLRIPFNFKSGAKAGSFCYGLISMKNFFLFGKNLNFASCQVASTCLEAISPSPNGKRSQLTT